MIRILRPYANTEEYLAHEHSSIDAKSMLLIDHPPLPVGTAVVFEIELQNGQKPIRAEAKVAGHVAPTDNAPGGLRVRFKRYGSATKAFIDRAIALSMPAPERAAAPVAVEAVPPRAEPAAAEPQAPEAATAPTPMRRSKVSSSTIDAAWLESVPPAPMRAPTLRPSPSLVPPPAAEPEPPVATKPEPPIALPEPAAISAPLTGESSGIHRRPALPVTAPANREELLERLRARSRNLARANAPKLGETG